MIFFSQEYYATNIFIVYNYVYRSYFNDVLPIMIVNVIEQKRLSRVLLVPLTLILPSQLVHQVGFACAVETHNSHHDKRLRNGRQDLQSFRINYQLPFSVLNETHWA